MYVHTNNSENSQGFLGAFCARKFASLRSDLLFSRGCNFCFFHKGLHELRIIPALRSACSASYTSVHATVIACESCSRQPHSCALRNAILEFLFVPIFAISLLLYTFYCAYACTACLEVEVQHHRFKIRLQHFSLEVEILHCLFFPRRCLVCTARGKLSEAV